MSTVLIIRKGYTGSGIERASSLMANYFSSKGVNTILLSIYSGGCAFKIDKKVKHIEIVNRIENIKRKPKKNILLKILRTLNIIFVLRKEIRKLNPDVILTYGEYINSSVIVATRGLKIPVIISDRLSPLFSMEKLLNKKDRELLKNKLNPPSISLSLGMPYGLYKKLTYCKADGCIAQTEFSKKVLMKKIRMKNVVVIPNPVYEIQKVDVPKKNQIICVGRLSEEKGQEYLIESFSGIKNKDWNLVFVGRYKYKYYYDKLLELVAKFNIKDRVQFLGWKEDFSKELSESQIFVLSSFSEGYPNALIEAMSVPLPCISSDCVAGPRDIIQNGVNGILVKPGDVEEMRTAIQDLIENPDKRKNLAKEAYKIREKLSKNIIAQQYLDYVLSFIKK